MALLIPLSTPAELAQELQEQRRTVDFDTFDIQLQQLITMLSERQIWAAPAYQRQFRWDNQRCSQLIESLILGIPIPNLFMATNKDNTWEVVDGLQRLSAIVKFAGSDELRKNLELKGGPLVLEGLQKIKKFSGYKFDALPPHIQLHVKTRPLKVVTLNDKSDSVVRFDLFERLNTGGIVLTDQEIRACVYQGKFADKLDELSRIQDFRTVVKLTEKQRADGTAEECVLRFFAFQDRYEDFEHSVKEFLNEYMKDAAQKFDMAREKEFRSVFAELVKAFPNGIMRPERKGRTPLNLYEGIAVGASLAMRQNHALDTHDLRTWIAAKELRAATTGATNDRAAVRKRIEFCRDRFLGRVDGIPDRRV